MALILAGCSVSSANLEDLAQMPPEFLAIQERELREILADEPGNTSALIKMAMVQLRQQRLTEAETLAARAAAIRPFDGRLAALQGEIYLAQKKHFRALTAFNRAIGIDPDQLNAYVKLAEIYFRLGQPDEGFKTLTAALRREANYFPARLLQAKAQYDAGEFRKAAIEIEKALRIRPMDERALVLRIKIAKNHGAFGQAKVYLAEGLAEHPGSMALLREQLDLFHQQSDWEKAAPAAEKLLRISDRPLEMTLLLAKVFGDMGKTAQGDKLLQEVLRSNPRHPAALVHQGRGLLKKNDPKQALALFTLSAETSSANFEGLLWKAIAHYRLGQFPPGDVALGRAEKLAPGHPQARLLRVRRLVDQREFGKAADHLDKYLSEFPADGAALLAQAELFIQTGDVNRAEAILRNIAPGLNPEALQWAQARLALMQGRDKRAIILSTPLIKRKNPPWQVYHLHAAALGRSGNVPAALKLLDIPIKGGLGQGHLHRLAGELNLLAGRAAPASAILGQGVRRYPLNLALVDSMTRLAIIIGKYAVAIPVLEAALEQPGSYRAIFLDRLVTAYNRLKRPGPATKALRLYQAEMGVFSTAGGAVAPDSALGYLFYAGEYDIRAPATKAR